MGSKEDKRDGNRSNIPSQHLPVPWVGARMGNKSEKIAI